MSDNKGPHLADLVRAGEAQEAAVAITDFVFMARDISNAYLVTTGDGDVMVNTGFLGNGAKNKALLAPHRTGAMRRIVLTQHHADHYGGLDEFRETGTEVIVHANFMANLADSQSLQPFFAPRTAKLWGSTLGTNRPPPKFPEIAPTTIVDRQYAFEQGGRRFEVIWTPDGEATDCLCVWLPDDRIVFTGNLVGPVWNSMPFLVTLRGDKPRLVRDYLASLEKLRSLDAEMVITGHGDPIRGADAIRADIDRMHAAVSWVRDYTFDGMRAGKDVHTLMREIKLPEELRIGEFHGKVSWAVRSIWEQYSGWFHYDSTTSLYGVPRSSIDADLARLAGGADVLAKEARAKLDAGKPLEAIHLVDIALGADTSCRVALEAKRDACAALLAASGGSNLSETMWLRSEIAAVEAKLA